MSKSRSRSSGHANRAIAFFFTMFFHISLLGGLYYTSNNDTPLNELLPEFVKEWFDSDEKEAGKKDKNRA